MRASSNQNSDTPRYRSSFLRTALPEDRDCIDDLLLAVINMKTVQEDFEDANNVKEVFEVVKDAVRLTINESRAGIDLGLTELGNGNNELLSAYHPVGSNIIVLNRTPLKRITQTQPQLMKPYVFVVLLHEYIHSLGYLDEATVRDLTHKITKSVLNGSTATDMAKDMRKYFPFLLYPGGHLATDGMDVIELDDIDYIG